MPHSGSGSKGTLRPWPLSEPPTDRKRTENVYVSLRKARQLTNNAHSHISLAKSMGNGTEGSIVPRSSAIGNTPDRRVAWTEPQLPTPPPTSNRWLRFKDTKMMKKISKKMDFLGHRSGKASTSTSTPRLLFHTVHGDNIQVIQSGTVARRGHSFCKAVAFSDRPVKVNERICLKFVEVSNNWSGVVRFGYTSHDPVSLKSSLPKYACPDLTSRPGFWAKAFHDYLVKKDSVLFYYVTNAGDVHFGINGEELGIFFKDVDTRGPLWALLDIYGNTTAVEFVDPLGHLNNSRRNIGDDMSLTINSLGSLSLKTEVEVNPVKYYPDTVFYNLQFHQICGMHISLGKYRFSASRLPDEYTNGYVFTSRPLAVGETIILQIQKTEPLYVGSLTFGLTSCNPDTIDPNTLPEDSFLLQDRAEYWVVKKEVGSNPSPGDELAFNLSPSGAVFMSKNGGPTTVLMHVDTSVALYGFFDVYGRTQRVAIAGTIQPQTFENEFDFIDVLGSEGAIGVGKLESHPPHFQNENQPVPSRNSKTSPKATVGSGIPSVSTRSSHPVLKDSSSKSGFFHPLASEGTGWNVDCVACCEKPVDSVFYQCGHLSMCFDCAYDYWKRRQKTCCPICRSPITDLIRVYKS